MLIVMISRSRSWTSSVIAGLAVGEGHRLAADWKVPPLRPPHVVLGHEDASEVRMPPEGDPEKVIDLALLRLRRREKLNTGIDLRQAVAGVGEHRFDPDTLDPVAVDQLVVDAEARFGGQVVGGVEAGEEVVALARLLLQPAQHLKHASGVDDQRRLAAVEGGGEDGAGAVTIDFSPDQLESGSVRQGSAPRSRAGLRPSAAPPRRPWLP